MKKRRCLYLYRWVRNWRGASLIGGGSPEDPVIHRLHRRLSFHVVIACKNTLFLTPSPHLRSGRKLAKFGESLSAFRVWRKGPVNWRMMVRNSREILTTLRPIRRLARRRSAHALIAARDTLFLAPFTHTPGEAKMVPI